MKHLKILFILAISLSLCTACSNDDEPDTDWQDLLFATNLSGQVGNYTQ